VLSFVAKPSDPLSTTNEVWTVTTGWVTWQPWRVTTAEAARIERRTARLFARAEGDICVVIDRDLPGQACGKRRHTPGSTLPPRSDATSSPLSRLPRGPLSRRWGGISLVVASTLATVLTFALLPLTTSVIVLTTILVGGGFILGLGQPLTMSFVATAAPAGDRATALTLRLLGATGSHRWPFRPSRKLWPAPRESRPRCGFRPACSRLRGLRPDPCRPRRRLTRHRGDHPPGGHTLTWQPPTAAVPQQLVTSGDGLRRARLVGPQRSLDQDRLLSNARSILRADVTAAIFSSTLMALHLFQRARVPAPALKQWDTARAPHEPSSRQPAGSMARPTWVSWL
jgi:hypothetical protein